MHILASCRMHFGCQPKGSTYVCAPSTNDQRPCWLLSKIGFAINIYRDGSIENRIRRKGNIALFRDHSHCQGYAHHGWGVWMDGNKCICVVAGIMYLCAYTARVDAWWLHTFIWIAWSFKDHAIEPGFGYDCNAIYILCTRSQEAKDVWGLRTIH